MKKIVSCALFICASHLLFAQSNYNKALGVKFPVGISVTYKKFISDTKNIEGMITIGNKGYRITGLYEFNFYFFRNFFKYFFYLQGKLTGGRHNERLCMFVHRVKLL